MSATVIHGDALDELRRLPDASIDSLCTDPPAGISFMGKEWDDYGRRARGGFIATLTPIFAECLRVLKPGAHGLVWALPRTSHWTATALEDAGFEVRDVVTHHFGSGFPKSLDVSKAIDKAAGAERVVVDRQRGHTGDPQVYNGGWVGEAVVSEPATVAARQWNGWGTALKPASEHWILVRKPLGENTVAANVLAHGTGALNIDASRIGTSGGTQSIGEPNRKNNVYGDGMGGNQIDPEAVLGRWPTNLVLTHGHGCVLVGTRTIESDGHYPGARGQGGLGTAGHNGQDALDERFTAGETVDDWRCTPGCPVAELDRQSEVEDGASRFFYCAKPDRDERDTGLEGLEPQLRNDGRTAEHDTPALRRNLRTNHHPTVKAAELMCYLCRLVTPPKGTVLDPFMGSGSTGMAALRSGFSFVGIEREAEYVEIARRRIVGDSPLFNALT